jgi:hypothetical protein
MRAAKDPHDAAFGPRRRAGSTARASVAALDTSDNAISVHRVSQSIWGNEKIAVDVFSRRLGNDKAVAIAMRDQPSSKEIGIARGCLRRSFRRGSGFLHITWLNVAGEAILAASQFFYDALALQSR